MTVKEFLGLCTNLETIDVLLFDSAEPNRPLTGNTVENINRVIDQHGKREIVCWKAPSFGSFGSPALRLYIKVEQGKGETP